MLCVIVGRMPGSPVVPIWVQETVIMHPEPSLQESCQEPYAEIYLTVALRRRIGSSLGYARENSFDFSFIHPGKLSQLVDVTESFTGGPYSWVNNVTPKTRFGPIKRGLEIEDREVWVTLEPLMYRDIRFDVRSPLRAAPTTCKCSAVYSEPESEHPLFTLTRVKCDFGESLQANCCITRLRFLANEGIEYAPNRVKFPIYGPTHVEAKLYRKIEDMQDERRKEELKTLFQEVSFDQQTTFYDLAVLNANTNYFYDMAEAYNHEQLFVFPVTFNGELEEVSSKRMVHYLTSDPMCGDFTFTVQTHKPVDPDEEDVKGWVDLVAGGEIPDKERKIKEREEALKKLHGHLEQME